MSEEIEEVKDVKALTYLPQRNYKFETDAAKGGKYPNMSEADWRKMVGEDMQAVWDSGQVEYMAYIFHDKDKVKDKDSGLILDAPLHCHAFVTFKESIGQADAMTIFQASSENNCRKADNRLGAALYMIHMSDSAIRDKKVKYTVHDVVEFGISYEYDLINKYFWQKSEEAEIATKLLSKAKADALIETLSAQVQNGEIRKITAQKMLRETAGHYWYRRNRHEFDGDQLDYIQNRVEHMTEHNDRDLETLYIMGAGGSGKSFIANKIGGRIAKGRGVYNGATNGKGKTPDMMNGVTDQFVAILNEFSANALTLDESTSCFDPNVYAPFPSRNENKDFIGGQIILTNSVSPLRYAKDVLIYDKGGKTYQDSANRREIDYSSAEAVDKYWQVRRRLTNLLVLMRDEKNPNIVHGGVFNLRYGEVLADGSLNMDDGTHVLVGSISFESAPKKEPVITDAALDELERLLAVDTSAMLTGVTTIDGFLEAQGLIETSNDSLISDFIEDVVNKCVWDVVPSAFLYAIFQEYRAAHYPNADKLSVRELSYAIDSQVSDWEWKDYSVKVFDRMDADEPLITEYGLDKSPKNGKPSPWGNSYNGDNSQMKRDFKRKEQYRSALVRVVK